MILDNHDERLQYVELVLERPDLTDIPDYPLPEGYRFVPYRPGDENEWIRIEISARELRDTEQGMEVFQKYFGGHEKELERRMLFIENPDGLKIATASAWWNIHTPGPADVSMLHWVAVAREYQGRGLSRCLISRTLRLMKELGHTGAVVPTQTTTWVACGLYMDFGFRPIPGNMENSRLGWQIMLSLTDHPALSGMKPARLCDVLLGTDSAAPAGAERSAGAVVVSTEPAEPRFLLVKTPGGVWGFPKGHINPGESARQAAIREIMEETGLTPVLKSGFQRLCLYLHGKPGKAVTYFLASCGYLTGHAENPFEIAETRWMDYASALAHLPHEDQKSLLRQAAAVIKMQEA